MLLALFSPVLHLVIQRPSLFPSFFSMNIVVVCVPLADGGRKGREGTPTSLHLGQKITIFNSYSIGKTKPYSPLRKWKGCWESLFSDGQQLPRSTFTIWNNTVCSVQLTFFQLHQLSVYALVSFCLVGQVPPHYWSSIVFHLLLDLLSSITDKSWLV